MAAGIVRPGPIRPTPPGGGPNYQLPGSNIPNPDYATQKQTFDTQNAAKTSASKQAAAGRADFMSGANNHARFSQDFTDPETGVAMHRDAEGPQFGEKLQNFDQLMSRFGNMDGTSSYHSSGAGGTAPHVGLDTGAIAAGDAAAYSQAKDKVGGATQGLLKSLQNQFSSRGLRGSSIEGQQVGSALESGAGQLDDVARSQAVEGSRRAVDLAKTSYGGDITQRGQDLDAETANRQIDAQSRTSRYASLMGLFNAFNGMKY